MPARSCPSAGGRARAAARRSSHPARRARASGSPSARASQPLVDRPCGALALRDCLDDAVAAVQGVAAGEELRVRRPAGLVDLQPSALELEPLDPLGDLGARLLAYGLHSR